MNTSPRFDRRWWYGLPLALLALMLVFEPSALDFAFSDLFFVQGQGFIGRRNDFLEDVLHDRAKQLVIVIGVLAIAGFLLSLLLTRLRPLRRTLGYLVLAMALSTSFVTPLKKVSQMHCPWSLQQYGGVEHFSPLLGPRAEPVEKPGNCWPGGHAAAGFALFALFFALRNSHPRSARAALIASASSSAPPGSGLSPLCCSPSPSPSGAWPPAPPLATPSTPPCGSLSPSASPRSW